MGDRDDVSGHSHAFMRDFFLRNFPGLRPAGHSGESVVSEMSIGSESSF